MRTAHGYFEQCVDLARDYGLAAIEVANRSMLAISLIFLGRCDDALEEARATMEMARRVGNGRAELIASHVLCFVALERGDAATMKREGEESLHLARRIGTRRFEPEAMIFIAHAESPDAVGILRDAVAICRETGMHYVGPLVLASLAFVSEDADERRSAFEEGEALLREGCVSHNHLMFYRRGIDAALAVGDRERARRYADALEDFTASEPLPWSTFYVARARAMLAVAGTGGEPEAAQELQRLISRGRAMGLLAALPALEAAAGRVSGAD